ncbi:MAG: outer membrane protein assembly factor [Proteobacteria bacterium]|nr:outer membrane protein assembly factor [Pseudomonadota bacterium]MBU1686943.1 outer membrane protein assembly factor [Pseudomonadota bacterium]
MTNKTASLLAGISSALLGMMIWCFALSTPSLAMASGVDPVDSPVLEKPVKEQQRWAAMPVIASSPETGLILGGMLFHFFPVTDPEKQASTIDLMAYGTTQGQYAMTLSPNLFSEDGRYRFNANFYGELWEANYYHLGNDSPDISEKYTATNLGGSLTVERRLPWGLVIDLVGLYEKTGMEVIGGGLLETDSPPGIIDATYVGLGFEGGYDTRDNTNAPARGIVGRYRYVAYDKEFGSDLDFTIQTFGLGAYHRLAMIKDSVLAFAATLRKATGSIPFRYLSSPDGSLVLRGIENGRYRDNALVAFQSELRFPVYRRFSGTVFAEVAQVAPSYRDFETANFKTSLGGGLRYALNPTQRFNIRGDVAWVDGGIGVVINVREAF